MNRSPPASILAYGVSLAGLAAAVLLRWLLDPVLGDTLPLITLFGAVGVAVWFGGYRPAVLVVALGCPICDYLFFAPRGHIGLSDSRDAVGLLLFLATAWIIIVFGEALRRTQQHSRLREEEARRQAERMRTTLASIGDGVITTDADGRITSMNTVAENLTGWTDDEAVGMPLAQVFRIVSEATRVEIENPALRALKGGVIVGLANHTILIAKDGTERPIDDSAAPIRSELGEVAGCVLVFRDISERHRAEAEQRVVQEQITKTLESVTDGFMRYDRDWRIVYANAEAERINRLTRSKMLGRTLWEVFPALAGTTFEGEFRRAVADRVTIEFENYYEPFGRWYSLKGYPTDDGGLTTFIRDITEQKVSREALERSEARLRRVFESNVVGMIQWNLDLSLILDANETFLRMTGYTRDDVAAGRLNFRDMTPPEWTQRNEEGIHTIRADGHAAPYEKEYFRKDGTRAPLIIAGTRFDDSPSEGMSLIIDISDRKRAEQEIVRLAAESERQRRLYETVLTNTPDFVYVFSLDHKVVYANDALIKMWGRGHKGAIGKTFLEIGYEPWHAEMHDREIDQVRATRQPIRGEVPFNGTHGRRHYDYIFVPVIGADGEVEAVAGTTRDVTERRQQEERQAFLVGLADTLRPLSDPLEVQAEASRALGQFLGASRVAYFEICDDDYVIERDYTSGVQPLAGRYPVASFGQALLTTLLAGHTVVEADATTEPDRPAEEQAAFAAIQVRGHVDVPLVKDGRFVAGMTVHLTDRRDWTRQEVALIEDTAERTWSAVERARVEREVARLAAEAGRERTLFDTALSNTTDFNFIFGIDGRFVYANRALLALWGRTAGEALGRSMAELGYPPDVEAQLLDNIRRVAQTGLNVRDETPFTDRTGETGHYEYALAPIFDAAGAVVQVVGSARDIRDRKRTEADLRRLAAELSEAARRKDEFLATLAHELRNPLAPIRNGLQIIRMAGVDGTVEQARAMMERQLTQLVRLVDDLLDVSRVTSGKLALRKDRLELKAVIDAAVETSRPAIELAGHELAVVGLDGPVLLDGDAIRLAQVVANLLNNSAKYTHPGGHIRLTVRREEGMAVVVVADNGIGIPPHMLGKVFDMFTQVDRALEKTTGGLGIGLSLVKGLVEMHGGTIEARSEGEGRGSEFIVRLPVAVSVAQKVEPSVIGEPVGSFRRRRILVADDNIDSARSLGRLLELYGNDVRTANDGLRAVEAAEKFQPEIILLDIAMPELNGYEVCRRIREQPWSKNTIIVAMTGWGQEEDKRRSHEAGFDLHLVKPVDFGAIKKILAS